MGTQEFTTDGLHEAQLCCAAQKHLEDNNSKDYRISENLPSSSQCSFNNHSIPKTKEMNIRTSSDYASLLKTSERLLKLQLLVKSDCPKHLHSGIRIPILGHSLKGQQSHLSSILLISKVTAHSNTKSPNLRGSN